MGVVLMTLGGLTVVASIGLMADCSKQVAKAGIEQAEECGRNGGTWSRHMGAIDEAGICIGAKR